MPSAEQPFKEFPVFFAKLSSFTKHVGTIHKTQTITMDELLQTASNPKLRVLTPGEVDKIKEGNGKEVIKKKAAVTGKNDGAEARVVAYPKGCPLPKYSTIVQKDDGTYVELRCSECNGKSNHLRGQNTSRKPRLEFLKGAAGMTGHINQAHGMEVNEEWVKANCGLAITAQKLGELKNDQTGKLIDKVDATPAETKEKREEWIREQEEKAKELKKSKEENRESQLTQQPAVTDDSTGTVGSDDLGDADEEDGTSPRLTSTTKPAQTKRKINDGEGGAGKRVRQPLGANDALVVINSAPQIMSTIKELQDKRAHLRGTDGNRVEDSATTMAEYQNQRFGFGYAKGYKSHGWAPFNQRPQASSEDASIEEV
ncbi:hypothetical protein LTR37_015189 [Vermiconidia calcicola]|uniref:Uncharacterized protein n=1 Tax=Vermiconidia calcicola TaxID=1690605 RepID=A0ACC3MST6_9PEZI|nr:hypothetical protein LTR37_015189 [Vermiconidia calcicola]